MTTKPKYAIIPYQREDRDIYDGLEFAPNILDLWPDNMFQEPALLDTIYILKDHLVTSPRRKDVFISGVAFICYDRSNLNVRVGPDCCIALGVDARAIRERLLYLPWEVGKMPDFVLEMASHSTAEYDIGEKREIYERIGVGEYWLFDASGGNLYGEPIVGLRQVDGRYLRIPLTHGADGSISGYSPALDLYLSWERQEEDGEGLLYIYDPATGRRLESYSEVKERAESAEIEVQRLQAELRRLRGE